MNPGRDDHREVIAIDGPAAAGKSTVARHLAARLGALLFDTGSLYRALTLAAMRSNVSPDDGPGLACLAEECEIEVRPAGEADGRLYSVFLHGDDVTWELRSPRVERCVSKVAAHPEVRAALLPHQRRIARTGTVVMVGRDIGTVVVPDAGVKIFLLASERERARRRHDEQRAKGGDLSPEEVLADLRRRDAIDASRDSSPLRQAEDAVAIETDGLDIDEVVAKIIRHVEAASLDQPPGRPRSGV